MQSDQTTDQLSPQLHIVCGDPAREKAASYTRFVLPFSYSVNLNVALPGEQKAQKHEYVDLNTIDDNSTINATPVLEDAKWRKRYLTTETAQILFHRAKWLQMKNWSSEQAIKETVLRGETIKIQMAPPRIVLFHWPKTNSKSARIQDNPLQTGFLIIELFFPQDSKVTLEQFLELNEYFRYCRQPFDKHPAIKDFCNFISPLWPPDTENVERLYEERWMQWIDDVNLSVGGAKFRLHIKEKKEWMVYADDRTFVWTCAILPDGGKPLQPLAPDSEFRACNFGHWIKLLNVDRPAMTPLSTHRHTKFESEWADERTYHRWEELGTFYGFSYHSGAMIGPPETEPPLWKHFGGMYFDQILLLFYLRVTLFRFSKSLCDISGKFDDKPDFETWMEDFQKIRGKFSIFTNLYQFPLVSNHQQGLEMFSLAKKALDIQPLFEEIQSEIHHSHDYFLQKQNTNQVTTTTRLTIVATIGLTITFVLSFFGIDGIGELVEMRDLFHRKARISIIAGVVVFVAFFIQFLVIKYSDSLNKLINGITYRKDHE